MTINGPKSSVWHIATIGVVTTMMAEDYSEKSISMEKMKKPIDRSIDSSDKVDDFSFICNGPANCRVRCEA